MDLLYFIQIEDRKEGRSVKVCHSRTQKGRDPLGRILLYTFLQYTRILIPHSIWSTQSLHYYCVYTVVVARRLAIKKKSWWQRLRTAHVI